MGTDRPRLAVRVTKDAERQIRGGHPWVYDRSIVSMKPGVGRVGDLAVIFDSSRRFLAIGLYDPGSPIRVKVLHAGSPTPIDREWWASRVDAAIHARRLLVEDPSITGYRVVHGENDQLPGLVVDRYGHTLVLKLYSSAWFAHLDEVLEVIADRLGPERVVLRLSRLVQRDPQLPPHLTDGTALVGSVPAAPVEFLENGMAMEADVVAGQKTGYFLDQRDNRMRVRALAAGRRVLDVYCCTGGFSVHASAGDAVAVHSVDISSGAVAATRRVMARHASAARGSITEHTTATADAMDEMERLRRLGVRFGLVVVDPPSFASRGDHRARALRAYDRLAAQATALTEPGGTVVLASCSSRVSADEHLHAVTTGAARSRVRLAGIEQTGHAIDHPVGFAAGSYLKAVFATVDPLRSRT